MIKYNVFTLCYHKAYVITNAYKIDISENKTNILTHFF